MGLLYVRQREMAAVAPHDKSVNIIGSDDATTCIIVVVRHSGSGAVAMSHLDGSGTDEAVPSMIARVQELSMGYPEGRIELQLIGGFRDQKGYSEELFYNIMREFRILGVVTVLNFHIKTIPPFHLPSCKIMQNFDTALLLPVYYFNDVRQVH